MTKRLERRAPRAGSARVWTWGATFLAFLSAPVAAVEPQYEYRKRVESAQTITALTSELMGESVSLYNGATEFRAVDIDVPGNNALPVQMARRFKIELHPLGRGTAFNANLKGAESWDLEVPYIAGTFGGGPWSSTRCSVPSAPSAIGFEPTEFWNGTSVHVPGESDRSMLIIPTGLEVPERAGLSQWTTRERDMFECIPMKSGLAGEGFSMLTADGRRFDFDVAVSRVQGTMIRTIGINTPTRARVQRTRYYLLASRVSDRFGNYVDYSYNADGHPTSIQSSDGRLITMSYSNGRISSASAHGRTWHYEYSGDFLSRVNLPDATAWSYAQTGTLSPNQPDWDGNSNRTCSDQPPAISAPYQLSITHPGGALGVFTFSNGRQYRAGVHMSACLQRVQSSSGGDGGYYYYVLGTPNFYDVMSLRSKTVLGPGVDPMVWTYTYGGGYQPLFGSPGSPPAYPCTTCPADKTVTIIQPDGSANAYRYGFLYGVNEGQLLGTDTLSAAGELLRSEVNEYLTESQVQNQPFFPRYGNIINGDSPTTATVRPLLRKTILQQGSQFTWEASGYDIFGRPVSVSKFSDGGGGGVRNELSSFHDDKVRWILGQPEALYVNGVETGRTTYDSNSMPVSISQFGQLISTHSYNSDGTPSSIGDANGSVISLSDWKRGIPQLATFPATPDAPSGTSRTATVSDQGWITRITDELGISTSYEYDSLGRLSRVVHPQGGAVAWNDTTLSFTRSPSDAFGLPAGHWQRTLATGSHRQVTYLDALWRPVLAREYDSERVASTERFVRKVFDHANRETFTSFPSSSSGSVQGVWTDYDAIGRVRASTTDSELGLLATTTAFLRDDLGYYTLTTNSRGYQTRTWFQAFDSPLYETPRLISQPAGALTEINRDAFGKPLSIARRDGPTNQYVTRSYVYDPTHRLCKTVEPETGATILAYDSVGNITWSASGSSLTNLDNCSHDHVPLLDRVTRTYDAMNRLQEVVFPDNLGNTSHTYFADGLLATMTTDNGGIDVVTNAYSYDNRRHLVGEAVAVGDFQGSIGYAFDADGHASGITLPGGRSVLFEPNGFGQPTRAGDFAFNATYFPNGGLRQFTYGNGITRTQEQNVRGLVDRTRDAGAGLVVYDESLDYDANANVAAISDGLPGARGNRTMAYDGLDRLTGVSSPMFGDAQYQYNALDNLTAVHVAGGPRARNHSYTYDANNRLSLVTSAITGATVASLDYDARGNVRTRGATAFDFDHGNRLRKVTGVESYVYDGHGRRVKALRDGGRAIYSVYGRDGVLRFQRDERVSESTEYVHLGSTLVARVATPIALAAPSLSAPGYSPTGEYSVSWSVVAGADRYQLEEAHGGAGYALAYDGSGTSAHIAGRGAGEWSYRARACAQANCGAWSAPSAVTVQLPPNVAPGLHVPSSGLGGSYTVSWDAVGSADLYELVERPSGGAWVLLANDAATSRVFNGQPLGQWEYQVRACNAAGCGPWSLVGAIHVIYPPAVSPILATPAHDLTGNYVISWTPIDGAQRYEVQEQFNGGAWTSIHNSSVTNVAVSGRATGVWGYHARACNDAGCSPWSLQASTNVLRPPVSAPSLSAPSTSATGNYDIAWSAVENAASYELMEWVAGRGWVVIFNGPGTSYAATGRTTEVWVYQVRACNAAGCGGWSPEGAVTVTRPPAAAPVITQNRKRQWYVQNRIEIACDLAWTPVESATHYELQVAGNGLLQYSGPNTVVAGNRSSATYCAPSHQVRACNGSGCSAWSDPPKLQQLVEFGTPGGSGVEP